jgi:hypothetical protein
MFNVKALWWTLLAGWILGSTYWHVCKIQSLCHVFENPQLFLTEVVTNSERPGSLDINLLHDAGHGLNVSDMVQYIVMFTVALLLGFFTGRSYERRKTRDLKYKLNRINHELQFYQSQT